MDSILTTLETRVSPDAVGAGAPTSVSGTARATGQYVYDLFFADKGETTKMDFVRWCVEHVEVDAFKKCLKDFVEIAAKHSDAYKKTAQNHQSVMRTAYGAWRFARAALTAAGGGNETGYQAMRVLGKQALKDAGLKWDGTPAPTEADAAVLAADKAQASALAQIRKDNPVREGETPFEHEQRCRGILAANIAENDAYLAEIAAQQDVADLAAKVKKLCGDSMLDVLTHLINSGEFDVIVGE